MKEKGIGRPSTYAKIIQTLLERYYVVQTKKNSLLPRERGIHVHRFLEEHFKGLVSVDRTKELEKKMDRVENGEIEYQLVLQEVHREVVENILDKESEIAERVGNEISRILVENSELSSRHIDIAKCIEGLKT